MIAGLADVEMRIYRWKQILQQEFLFENSHPETYISVDCSGSVDDR